MGKTSEKTIKKAIKPETWDRSWHPKFLEALRLTCSPARAARVAAVDRSTAYRHRDELPDFRAQWDDAIREAVELLEAEGWQRARKTSDTLLIFLLKAHKPEMYREKFEHNHKGNVALTFAELAQLAGDEQSSAGNPGS